MKRLCIAAALAVGALAAPALAADTAAGSWVFTGKVQSFDFKLYCTFNQAGEKLTGVCHDTTPKGKAHTLTSGSVKGDAVRFVYQSNFLATKFDAAYSGVLKDGKISGAVTAGGRKGVFLGAKG